MLDVVSLPLFASTGLGAVLALLAKGTLLCLLGVSIASDCADMPAIVRHRIALGTVSCLAALPFLAAALASWELPILPRDADSWSTKHSLSGHVLVSVYVGVVVFLLLRLCSDVLEIAKLSGRARSVATAAQLSPGLEHPRGNAPVKYSAEIRAPLTWGWLRPKVLMPESASGWNADDLAMVLQHELAHVHRGDWAGHLLARCVHAIYWPVPGIRVLLRQLSLAAEQACDDRVLAAGVTAPTYAAMLLRLAQGTRVPAAVSLGHGTELSTRIRYLVVEIVDHSAFARGSATTFFSCFVLTLAVATAQLGQRPELPEVGWGRANPVNSPGETPDVQHPVAVNANTLSALAPGPARPLPPPPPLRPPRSNALEKPSVPPPTSTAPLQ